MIAAEQLGQGDEVSETLSHLLAANGDEVVVHPVVHTLGVATCYVLGNLALVVGEHEVHASAVNVEFVPEVFFAHDGALQVPAGESFAPRGGPAHNVLGLSLFPEGEVVRGAFVALPVQASGAFQGVVQIAAAQHSVMVVLVVFLHVEIDAAVGFIGIAGVENFLDGLDLLHYVAAGAGLDGGRRAVQETHGFVVTESISLHHFHGLQLFQAGLLCYLVLTFVGIMFEVADIGDIAYIAHLVAQVAQQLAEHVVCHSRPGMAEMSLTVHGGAAYIHSNMSFMDRLEELLGTRKRVGKSELSHRLQR